MKKTICLAFFILASFSIIPVCSAKAAKPPKAAKLPKASKPKPVPLPAPIVDDDGIYTTNGNELHAVWEMPDSNLEELNFQYSIVTDKNYTKINKWKKVGSATEVTETGLELLHGNAYYFAVRAKEQKGKRGDVGYSDGIVSFRPLL